MTRDILETSRSLRPQSVQFTLIYNVSRRIPIEPCLSLLKPFRYSAPVDDVPDGVEVIGLLVLVLQVVRVFPSINAHKRNIVTDNRVLIHSSDDLKCAGGLVLDQPRPAAALDAGEGRVDLFLHVLKRTKVPLDGRLANSLSAPYVPLRAICRVISYL